MQWEAYARVKSIWDGDTFHADIDVGWHIWLVDRRIRIANISAPELTMPGGIQSKDYLGQLLPVGTLVKIVSKRLDQYGRTVALVELPDNSDVGSLMIAAKQAEPW